MTERTIQETLHSDLICRGHAAIVPNVYLWDWESDLVSVTRAGYLHEFEIKLTRSDFLADRRKTAKHNRLEARDGPRPDRFWYVAPGGIIRIDEVPEYAGLLEIVVPPLCNGTPGWWTRQRAKIAPRLGAPKAGLDEISKLADVIGRRYWSLHRDRNQAAAERDHGRGRIQGRAETNAVRSDL